MESIRSFIAIDLPSQVRRALASLQHGLMPSTPPGVKWVDTESLHLTLKFLGAVPANRLSLVSERLAVVVSGIVPLSLGVEGLGAFPNPRHPRVVWAGLVGEVDRLLQLQRAIDSALSPLGFAKEDRPFVPHLTLARLREDMTLQERQNFAQCFLDAHLEALSPFKVEAIYLMKSQLTPQRAIYSRLDSFSFH